MSLKSQIKSDLVPKHIAVIMDGNGRWAKNRGENRVFGHLNGVNSVRETLEAATEIGVKFLTLYAFSTENWDRPREEVMALMDLLVQTILKEIDSLEKNQVRLKVIGDVKMLPENCHSALMEAIDRTSDNDRITLILALSYSSRWEIQKAVQEIARDVKKGEITPDDIDQSTISRYLET